jgi:hypothetical protein
VTDIDLTWNDKQILAAMEPAFSRANDVLGRKFQQEITSNKWVWPRGESPRDIVAPNSGQLRDSYDPQPGKDGANPIHDHTWDTEYAMAVHEGATFKDPSRPPLPARPWTKGPIADNVLEKAFEKYGGDELGKIK